MNEPIADSRPYATLVFNRGGQQYVLRSDYERLREMLRWIPVSERLPEDDCRVIGWDGTRVSEIHFHVRSKESERWYSLAGHESPTHWMPLPRAAERRQVATERPRSAASNKGD